MRTSADTLHARTLALTRAFEQVARTRMQGVPVLNTRLQVQALGFAIDSQAGDGDAADVACGVLLTPWFMNLLRLPLNAAAAQAMLAPGRKAERDCGTQRFEFIGAHEAAVGAFEAASLFSPMFEFADQAAAVNTALEVLKRLRPPRVAAPARRGFLFGRSAAASAR